MYQYTLTKRFLIMFQASIWTRSVVFVTYFVIYTETTYTTAIAVVKSISAFCKKEKKTF